MVHFFAIQHASTELSLAGFLLELLGMKFVRPHFKTAGHVLHQKLYYTCCSGNLKRPVVLVYMGPMVALNLQSIAEQHRPRSLLLRMITVAPCWHEVSKHAFIHFFAWLEGHILGSPFWRMEV